MYLWCIYVRLCTSVPLFIESHLGWGRLQLDTFPRMQSRSWWQISRYWIESRRWYPILSRHGEVPCPTQHGNGVMWNSRVIFPGSFEVVFHGFPGKLCGWKTVPLAVGQYSRKYVHMFMLMPLHFLDILVQVLFVWSLFWGKNYLSNTAQQIIITYYIQICTYLLWLQCDPGLQYNIAPYSTSAFPSLKSVAQTIAIISFMSCLL